MFEYSLFKPKQFSCKLISNFLFKLITEEKRCFDRDSISQRPEVQQICWSNCETVSTTATNQEGLQRKSSLWEKLKCAARGLFPAPNCKWPPKPLHRETALFLYTGRTTGGLAGWQQWPTRHSGERREALHLHLRYQSAAPAGLGRLSPVPPRSQPRRSLRDSAVLGSWRGRAAGAPSLPGRRGAARQGGRESVWATQAPRLPAQPEPGSRGSFWKPRPEEHSPPVRPRGVGETKNNQEANVSGKPPAHRHS